MAINVSSRAAQRLALETAIASWRAKTPSRSISVGLVCYLFFPVAILALRHAWLFVLVRSSWSWARSSITCVRSDGVIFTAILAVMAMPAAGAYERGAALEKQHGKNKGALIEKADGRAPKALVFCGGAYLLVKRGDAGHERAGLGRFELKTGEGGGNSAKAPIHLGA